MTYLVAGTCYAVSCESLLARHHANGWFCDRHAPIVPMPAPGSTLKALREASGFVDGAMLARKSGSDLLKERPGGYVSRQRAERIAAGTMERQHR